MMTLNDRLAAYFKARPYQWVDGMELARVAGSYAWRSRCSELRRQPFNMVIENRVRQRIVNVDGATVKVSEYAYMPGVTGDRPAATRPRPLNAGCKDRPRLQNS